MRHDPLVVVQFLIVFLAGVGGTPPDGKRHFF
jgi:hypothetical protein